MNFETEVLKSNIPVIVDFYATWCGPCKALSPILDEIANEYREQVKVVKINVEEYEEIAKQYNIRSIPTLLFIKDGEVKHTTTGMKDNNYIKNVIEGVFNGNSQQT